jgi:hypothetical protein
MPLPDQKTVIQEDLKVRLQDPLKGAKMDSEVKSFL